MNFQVEPLLYNELPGLPVEPLPYDEFPGLPGVISDFMNATIHAIIIATICIVIVLIIQKLAKKEFHKIFKTFVFWSAIGMVIKVISLALSDTSAIIGLPILLLIATIIGATIDLIIFGIKYLIKKIRKRNIDEPNR